MFIRQVSTTNGVTKKKYTYLHLVESVRTEEGPRQRLVLNLGSLDIDRSQYQTLARRIEDILTGNRSLFEIDGQLERHARGAANKIFRKRAEEVSPESEEEFELISAKSLKVSSPRSLGPEYVCHAMWRELGLDTVLKREGVSARVLPILEALVVGRLIAPGSERWTKRWAEASSAIYEFSGQPMRNSLQSYYRGDDHLYETKDALEEHLSGREKDLFDLQESIVLYDLTNTYFEGEYRGNPDMAYGKSKERRSDCKLMTMGLVVDGEGFAKYSKIYPGNQYEADTLEEIVGEMQRHMTGEAKPTVVMDAGIATEENIQRLSEQGYRYIVVNRGKAPFKVEFDGMTVIKEDAKSGTKIEVKRTEHDNEVYLLVRSERRRLKEEAMMSRVEQLLVDRLKHLKAGLGKKHRVRRYSKVVEAIGRLKQKYGKAAQLYEITVIPAEEADPTADAVDIQWTKKAGRYDEARNAEGTYVLRSNRGDLTDEQIWQTYIMLGRIEASFKDMKSHLGLRPNFHQKQSRVDAHMFISVLAYHILHAIEHKLRLAGDTRSWATIKSVLQTHQRMTIAYVSKDNEGIRYHNTHRINSQPELSHLEIYAKLGLSAVPLSRRTLARKICSDNKPSQAPAGA